MDLSKDYIAMRIFGLNFFWILLHKYLDNKMRISNFLFVARKKLKIKIKHLLFLTSIRAVFFHSLVL